MTVVAPGSDQLLQRMMTLHPKIIDLTLDRMWRLLEALGNPQNDLPPVIHIAGTNGKGSTQAMILAGLEAMGKSVHAYTSPHLARFHERIRVAGALITEEALTAALDDCYAVNDGQHITYFEITTCAALLAFSRVPADYTLLEVGLGGRLDATNVVARPALTIITPVSIDHTSFLGETVEAIAGEKAGIIKQGVPCVIGARGVERVVEIKLNPDEKKMFNKSVRAVKGLIKTIDKITGKAKTAPAKAKVKTKVKAKAKAKPKAKAKAAVKKAAAKKPAAIKKKK